MDTSAPAEPGADRRGVGRWWFGVAGVGVLVFGPRLLAAFIAALRALMPDAVAVAVTWLLIGVAAGAAVVLARRRPPDQGDSRVMGRANTRPMTRERVGWVVGTVVWVALLCRPVLLHPTTRILGRIDSSYSTWLGWRLSELWRNGEVLAWRIPDAIAPIGLDLRLIDGLFPAAVVAVGNLATGEPILAYNLALAVGCVLNIVAGASVGRVLSDDRRVAVVAAIAFSGAPAITATLNSHITFLYAFPVAWLLREGLATAAGRCPPWWRLTGLLVLAYGCSAYHLLLGAGLYLVTGFLGTRNRGPAMLRTTLIGFVVAAVVLSPFAYARIDYQRSEARAGAPNSVKVGDAVTFANDGLGLVSPSPSTTLDAPFPRPSLGAVAFEAVRPAFPGLVLMAGAVVAAALGGDRRVRVLAGSGAVLWVLGLGPSLLWGGTTVLRDGGRPLSFLPWRAVMAVPGLGALRAPYRVNFAIAAVGTALVAIAAHHLLERLPRHQGLVLAGVAGAAALSLVLPTWTSDLALTPGLERQFEGIAATAGPDDALLVVPSGCRTDDTVVVAWQIVHRRPSVGCSASQAATPWYSGLDPWATSAELAALRCDQARIDVRVTSFDGTEVLDDAGVTRLRRQLGVRYVLLHRLEVAGCGTLARSVPVLLTHRVLFDDGDLVLIDLDAPARS